MRGGAMIIDALSRGEHASSRASWDSPMKRLPGAASMRSALTARNRSFASNSRGRPGSPQALSDGETARQMVLSVRVSSATTRFVVSGSSPRATHSTDA